MKIGRLLQSIRGRRHPARLTAAVVAVLLSVSLLVSFRPCCEPLASLFTQHSIQSGSFSHEEHSRMQASPPAGLAGFQDCCDHHSASSSMDLAKVLPAIPGSGFSQTDAAASSVFVSPDFLAMPRMVLPSVYDLSPPPFRIYLRFLHLLI